MYRYLPICLYICTGVYPCEYIPVLNSYHATGLVNSSYKSYRTLGVSLASTYTYSHTYTHVCTCACKWVLLKGGISAITGP